MSHPEFEQDGSQVERPAAPEPGTPAYGTREADSPPVEPVEIPFVDEPERDDGEEL